MEQLDFRAIRAIRGTANNGFEELCCQLAAAEPAPAGSSFVRNGTPDGGVEAYWVYPDQSEKGWQAKYFFSLEDSQWQQLDDSVRVALEAHPCLVAYTICLPIDLPDARVRGRKSLRKKWEDRVEVWRKLAAESGMSVEFVFWGEHSLTSRLAREEHAGRRWFFFRRVELSPDWFRSHVAEAFAAAGPRYTPELNVELPIATRFEALGYEAAFLRHLSSARGEFREKLVDLHRLSERAGLGGEAGTAVKSAIGSGDVLLSCLDEFTEDLPDHALLDRLDRSLVEAISSARSLGSALWNPGPSSAGRGATGESDAAQRREAYRHTLKDYDYALDRLSGWTRSPYNSA